MATGKRDIYCDLSRGAFVTSHIDPQGTRIPSFYHQDRVTIAIHPLERDYTRAQNQGAYSRLDPTGWSAALKVFKSDGTVLASQTSWTASTTVLTAALELNTAAMALVFPSSPITTTSIEAIFEIELTDGAGTKYTFQDTFTIKREYITAGSPTALPVSEYFTKEEVLAMFVRFTGNPDGSSITLRSSNGDYETVLQCNDDGSNASNAAG